MVVGRGCNDGREGRMHRNDQLDAGLLLFDVDGAVADVLRPHMDYIPPPLTGVEQKGQRQPGAGAYDGARIGQSPRPSSYGGPQF